MVGHTADPIISFREARRAARTARRAEYGRSAYNTVRPRGITGVLRERLPLSLLLWTAAQEGRLVWQDTDGFAVLEPPRSDSTWRSATGDPRLPLLRFADRYWESVLFIGPPALGLLLALGLGLSLPGSVVALVSALMLAVVAVYYVAQLMLLMVVRQTFALVRAIATRRDETRKAVDNAPFVHWTMPLCHQGVPGRAKALVDQTSERLRRLVISEAERAARTRGARIKPLTVDETLACLLNGATTTAARRALTAATVAPHTVGSDVKIAFMTSSAGTSPPARRLLLSGGWAFLYLAAMAAIVLTDAVMVAGWERQACGSGDCAGRPADYPSALGWTALQLLGWTALRMVGLDLPGPVAHSVQAVSNGLIVSLMTPMLVVVVVPAAIRQNRRWRRERRGRFKERVTTVTAKTKVLIIVASEVEHQAVRDAVIGASEAVPRAEHLDFHTVFHLGTVSAAEVLLARSGQGSLGPGASTLTAQSVLDQVRPDYLVLTGIGYGLMPDEQRIGEVMVSTQIRVLDHKEVADPPVPGGPPVEFPRGPRPDASVTMVSRAEAAAMDGWHGQRVRFGPMLALNTRVSSRVLHDHLRAIEPDAIGGDMEGSGVYAAGARGKVDWIVIKGISDWGGHGGTDRERAAESAARFVVHMIGAGGLNRPPAR
jgi:nucleoside phosphorylase